MADETQNSSKQIPNYPARSNAGKTVLKFLAVIGMLFFLIGFLMPQVGPHREADCRMQCKNNFKQIGIALHNYHDTYGSFPPAYTVDNQGNRLHSWRTLLLPMMDQRELHEKIDLSKPWDDPANLEVGNAKWEGTSYFAYHCPSCKAPEIHTPYQVVNSPAGMFYQNRTRKLADITDGTANTLMVVEVPADQAVHWMSPYDINEQVFQSLNEQSLVSHEGRFHILLADGHVKSISTETTTAAKRQALVTIAGNDSQEETSP